MGDSIFPPWYETPLQKKKKKERPEILTRGCPRRMTAAVEGAMDLASGKSIAFSMAKYGFRKDFGWTLFFQELGSGFVGFFFYSSSPPLPTSLFIIPVSVYTRPNLFVYTTLIRSIPERFLWPGSGGQARPCTSHARYTGMPKPQTPSEARGQLPAKVHVNSRVLADGRVTSSTLAAFLTVCIPPRCSAASLTGHKHHPPIPSTPRNRFWFHLAPFPKSSSFHCFLGILSISPLRQRGEILSRWKM